MTSTSTPISSASVREDARVIGIIGLAHGSSHFAHLLLAPLYAVFMRSFELSFADVGLLTSVFFVISGVGQALSGFLVDRVGASRVLLSAVGLFVAASLAAAMADSYAGLMLATVLAGLGNAPFHPCDFSILNHRVSPARLSYAFSAHGLSGNLGWALAPVFLVGITSLAHWRVAYVAAAVMYAGIWAVLWAQRAHLATPRIEKDAGSQVSTLAFLRLPVVWWCFGFFFLNTTTLAVVQSFGVPIMQHLFEADLQTATMTLSAYMVMGAVGMFVGGFLAAWSGHRHWSSDRVVAAAIALGAVLLLLCSTGALGHRLSLVVLAMTGFALGVAGPSRDLMIRKATPKGATGRVYGTVYSGLDAGFAVAPLLFGWLMDHGQDRWVLAIASGVLMVSVFVALGVGKRTAQA